MSEHPNRLRLVFVGVAASVSLIVAGVSAAGYGGIVWSQRALHRHSVCLHDCSSPAPSGEASAGPENGLPCTKQACNYLLLGSDSRNGLPAKEQKGFIPSSKLGGYNSDTIILVHLDGVTKHATILSFPRDLWVNIPGYGMNKINAAFAYGAADGYGGSKGVAGGAALEARTISNLTGLPINHELVVDLSGFVDIVNALHGVQFCTTTPLRDDPQAYGEPPSNKGSGLNMPHGGCYQMTGDDALALVRARYVVSGNGDTIDCISDFSRIARQQTFLRSVMNKMLSPAELPHLPTLIPAVARHLTVDKGLKITDLVDLARNLEGVASGNADFRTVPAKLGTEKVPQYSFPLSVLHLLPQANTLFSRLRHNQPLGDLGKQLPYTPPAPADIAVRVYDDHSEGHAQNDVYVANLSNAGFQMMATAAEPAPADLQGLGEKTGGIILYKKGFEQQAKIVEGFVPGLPIKQATPSQLPSDDTMIGVVVNQNFVHKNVGQGNTPTVQTHCPYSP